ncbi:MAG: SDR family NAD(P)-dependent oxidoreductase [Microthrixaceae bacterium]
MTASAPLSSLKGLTALVTGASGGLGDTIARALHREQMSLVVTGRRRDRLESLAADVGAEVVVADLCDRAAVDSRGDRFDGIDRRVANAGVGADVALAEETAEHIDSVIDVNLRAPMHLATAFVQRKLLDGRAAHVVTVGSLSALAATPETRLYNATKFGLRGFTLSLAQDLVGTNVGASIVEPGFVRDAGMFTESGIELPPGVRTSTPDQVAKAVITAVTSNRHEVFVAPVEMRLLSKIATVAPAFSAAVQRRLGTAAMKQGSSGVAS